MNTDKRNLRPSTNAASEPVAVSAGRGDDRLGSDQLELLAEDLVTATDEAQTLLIRKRLTRGFYGL